MAKKTKIDRLSELFKKAVSKKYRALAGYRSLREKTPLNENYVLLESQQGRTANGNLFYIAEELCSNPEYDDLRVFFVAKEGNIDEMRSLFGSHGITGLRFVVISSAEYIALLATAKYLVTDTSFPTYYIKRQGQVVWNTWHGTPLKAMGKKDAQALHDLGNVQKTSCCLITFPTLMNTRVGIWLKIICSKTLPREKLQFAAILATLLFSTRNEAAQFAASSILRQKRFTLTCRHGDRVQRVCQLDTVASTPCIT